jgi:GDP-mannose 6-dehydrogenase
MRISIFGLGYVGAVTMACLAKRGHTVIGVDVNADKVAALARGESPIIEPGLDELLREALAAGRLHATCDHRQALEGSDLSIVCVGTPPRPNGEIDLSHVQEVAAQMAADLGALDKPHVLVLRSTMLPGSTASLAAGPLAGLESSGRVSVVFYPEFLREGSAVRDFDEPAISVVGTRDGRQPPPEVRHLLGGDAEVVDWGTAELIKYACNAFHANKVVFANEIGRLGRHLGLDSRRVMELFCRDQILNLSPYYLRPGNPYGGSCLPKDVQALQALARRAGVRTPLLESLTESNEDHVRFVIERIRQSGCRQVVILGLAFKAGTDDLRGSAMVEVVRDLVPSGLEVRIYDPHLDPAKLMGANWRTISEKLPIFGRMLRPDLAGALGSAGLIVAAQRCAPVEELARHVTADHRILDINGWPELQRLQAPYEGLSW